MYATPLKTFFVLASVAVTSTSGNSKACTYPQPCWPNDSDWNSLNQTLQGSLVRARPPAYVCHEPNLDQAQCQVAQQNWTRYSARVSLPSLPLILFAASFGGLSSRAVILMSVADYESDAHQRKSNILSIAWENGDRYCNIDNNATIPCDQGLVPIYVAQAKSVADVQAAVKFAKAHKVSTRVEGASHEL
jgi:hypothetical protein